MGTLRATTCQYPHALSSRSNAVKVPHLDRSSLESIDSKMGKRPSTLQAVSTGDGLSGFEKRTLVFTAPQFGHRAL
jgi:hypothetical protein